MAVGVAVGVAVGLASVVDSVLVFFATWRRWRCFLVLLLSALSAAAPTAAPAPAPTAAPAGPPTTAPVPAPTAAPVRVLVLQAEINAIAASADTLIISKFFMPSIRKCIASRAHARKMLSFVPHLIPPEFGHQRASVKIL